MKTLYFARHGQSTTNAGSVFGDHADVALTALGRQQVATLGSTLRERNLGITTIISSSMLRARDTAAILAAELGLPTDNIEVDGRIDEIGAGDFDGGAFNPESRAIRDRCVLDGNHEHGLESLDEIVHRVTSFAEEVRNRPEEIILIVGHGFSGRSLRRVFAELPADQPLPQLDNAGFMSLYPYEEIASGELML